MINKQYTTLAEYYDLLNKDVDYKGWALFLREAFARYESKKTESVLDLACGTGKITLELAKLGYDMTGVDLSAEMLAIASNSALESNHTDILFLNQDMSAFELYGTVDATVCCLDSINYLIKPHALNNCFSLVHNYLVPDGLFIFDVNTPYKFENVYGNNDYILENGNVFCAWQNFYNPGTRICEFYLNIFAGNKDGTYNRYEEVQHERMYTKKSLLSALKKTGFEVCGIFSGFGFEIAGENDERWFFICRAKK